MGIELEWLRHRTHKGERLLERVPTSITIAPPYLGASEMRVDLPASGREMTRDLYDAWPDLYREL